MLELTIGLGLTVSLGGRFLGLTLSLGGRFRGLHLPLDQPRLLHDLVFDGADVRAGGAEEAQAVAAGGRLDLQQHPARRAEVHGRLPHFSAAVLRSAAALR